MGNEQMTTEPVTNAEIQGVIFDYGGVLMRTVNPTALLSNAPAGLCQRLEQLGVADAFDAIVISGREGLMKPDPAIFELTLERLDTAPEETVLVDDFRGHVTAARKVGLQAVRFRGLAPLRKWLRALGLSVPDPVLAPLPDVRAVIFDWGGVMQTLPDEAYVAGWERRLAQAVFLDDSLRNVDAARELGVHTIQFVDPATSLAELGALLGISDEDMTTC